MFKQACLIKKNTKTLRKKLEELGYEYANAIKSHRSNYDNLKEPWILCLFDSYILLDGDTYKDFKMEFEETPKPESISYDIKEFNRHQEEEFLIEASVRVE